MALGKIAHEFKVFWVGTPAVRADLSVWQGVDVVKGENTTKEYLKMNKNAKFPVLGAF